MNSVDAGMFTTASECLERLAQLKEKGLLEDDEYKELKKLFIAKMTCSAAAEQEMIPGTGKPIESAVMPSIPYGKLHAEIVEKLTSGDRSVNADPKQRAFRAMAEM